MRQYIIMVVAEASKPAMVEDTSARGALMGHLVRGGHQLPFGFAGPAFVAPWGCTSARFFKVKVSDTGPVVYTTDEGLETRNAKALAAMRQAKVKLEAQAIADAAIAKEEAENYPREVVLESGETLTVKRATMTPRGLRDGGDKVWLVDYKRGLCRRTAHWNLPRVVEEVKEHASIDAAFDDNYGYTQRVDGVKLAEVDESDPCAICGLVRTIAMCRRRCSVEYTPRCTKKVDKPENTLWQDEPEDKQEADHLQAMRERLAECRVAINEKAAAGAGFINFEFGGKVYKVPLAPFDHWARRRNVKDRSALMPWKPVCPSGYKMPSDDEYHTDAMVGAGIYLHASTEEPESIRFVAKDPSKPNERCSELIPHDEREKVIGQELFKLKYDYALMRPESEGGDGLLDVVVLAGEGRRAGIIHHPKPGERVPPGCIAVIPNASVDYEAALYDASAIVTEVGGALAHVVVVGRERGAIIVALQGARAMLQPGERAWVDTKSQQCGLGDIPVRRFARRIAQESLVDD